MGALECVSDTLHLKLKKLLNLSVHNLALNLVNFGHVVAKHL
jgi:hypothetical protein